MVNLRTCTKQDIDNMNYFQMLMSVIYEKGAVENIKKLSLEKLYQKAVELWELYSSENTQMTGSPPKKSKNSFFTPFLV